MKYIQIIFCIGFLFTSCTVIKKAPKGKPYLIGNSIEVKGGNFNKIERTNLIQRLENQLDDSSKITSSSSFFIFHNIKRPPVYDSSYSAISARNMNASLFHLGYYSANTTFDADTSGRKVKVKYFVDAGKQTLIDTVGYRMVKPALQELAEKSKKDAILKADVPVSKIVVLAEINRLVDTFRNNGYYKFTAAELKVRGDTTIEALTSVSDNPFEMLELLAKAQQQRDSPQIKLAVVLNPPEDSSRLTKFYLRKVVILPDFFQGDKVDSNMTEVKYQNYIVRYHQPLFKPSFLIRNVEMVPGGLYNQKNYYKTINNFSKVGVWESVNVRMVEVPDAFDSVDIFIELLPGRKFGFEAAIEASYSTSGSINNALSGNLFGISGNVALTNKNVGREAIRMTHAVRAGVELNNKSVGDQSPVNSQELSYSNSIIFPRLISPFKKLNKRRFTSGESFINTSVAFNNRLYLFNTQSVNLNYGWSYVDDHNFRWTLRPVNIEFNYLFNQTDSFTRILDSIPFLRYSYNTALIIGMRASVGKVYYTQNQLNNISKERSFKINVEESGLTWGLLPIFNKYKKRYIKTDLEYKYGINYKNTSLAFRFFTGVGVSIGNETTLPFFKQYFSGGSNGMRGWPIRGIGRGSQKLEPYGQNIFNDRTADMQLELNTEYRYIIARIIPNTLTLRGAVFADVGNIWNLRNSQPTGSIDSTQFKFRNIYRDIGVAAGTGVRLDFNYFVLRLDLGFRFKRPELSYKNNGWKLPSISFNDAIPKLFGRKQEYRIWRYENFNFTIGISYPF